MTVRPATPADVNAIAEIHVAAWQAAYRGLIPDSYLDELTIEKRLELWQRRVSQPRPTSLVVAAHDGSLAGFCLYGPTRDEDGKDRPTGEIIALNVRPDSWRCGVGSALCDYALGDAPRRGWTAMTLWILKGNERAGRFYEALGFSLDGTERLDTHVIGAPIYELRYRRAVSTAAAPGLSIRPGTAEDAERISRFVVELSLEFIVGEFTPEGRAHFLDDHTAAKVRQRLAGDFRFYLAEHAGTLAGVAAIRSNSHLYYLFVGKAHQRRGLARQLWLRVRDDSLVLGNPGRFTVNASNYAVPAYERLGFRRTEPTREKNGVLYNPMELTVSRAAG